MSSHELRSGCARLGSRRVAVAYPHSLAQWFDGLLAPVDAAKPADPWVRVAARADGTFDVSIAGRPSATGLDLGDALATVWEHVAFLLVDRLDDAMALHAAVLRRGDRFVFIPGGTGSGKSHLALWYRTQGFEFGSDEIVALRSSEEGAGEVAGTLARPAVTKAGTDATGLLRAGETSCLRQISSYGLLLRPAEAGSWPSARIGRGLVVFPRFVPGAALTLTALTPGECALRLIENCLNVRNLPRGGLSLAAHFARHLPAIALDYGETAQLAGTLDVLTRLALAAPVAFDDLADICAAFTAKSLARSAPAAEAGASPPESTAAAKSIPPAPTVARFPRRLTVGMATYDDFDGVYFTIQAIRTSHPQLDGDIEFVVIDNNPGGRCSDALSHFAKSIDGCRYLPRGEWSGTAIRNVVFEEASSPFVLCVDSHVLIAPGALAKLIAYCEAHPDSRDLLHGPLVYDDLRNISTHMDPVWRSGMYGIWASDPRGINPVAPVFEVPMHGMGLFACRRDAWPGFNPLFRGFGGEEGYIHEKVRQRGGRALCLPFLRWVHRFGRPLGAPYANRWEDRMRNYVVGFAELGLDTTAMEAHFGELLGAEVAARIFADIRRELELNPQKATAFA